MQPISLLACQKYDPTTSELFNDLLGYYQELRFRNDDVRYRILYDKEITAHYKKKRTGKDTAAMVKAYSNDRRNWYIRKCNLKSGERVFETLMSPGSRIFPRYFVAQGPHELQHDSVVCRLESSNTLQVDNYRNGIRTYSIKAHFLNNLLDTISQTLPSNTVYTFQYDSLGYLKQISSLTESARKALLVRTVKQAGRYLNMIDTLDLDSDSTGNKFEVRYGGIDDVHQADYTAFPVKKYSKYDWHYEHQIRELPKNDRSVIRYFLPKGAYKEIMVPSRRYLIVQYGYVTQSAGAGSRMQLVERFDNGYEPAVFAKFLNVKRR